MQECAFDQRGIIGGDIVNRRIAFWLVIGAADADNWHFDIRQQFFYLRVVVIGDNAIAQPLFDVFDTCAKIFFDKDIPFQLRCLQIFANAFNHLTVIGFVGVE